MKNIWLRGVGYLFLLFIFLSNAQLSSAQSKAPEKSYVFHLIDQNYLDYTNMIKGHDPFDFDNWKNLDLDRHKLEALIFRVAPVIGGCQCDIQYEPYRDVTPHARSIQLVKSGAELSHPITVFATDSRVQSGVNLSQSIIDPEAFFVGLYTHESRDDVLGIAQDQMQNLRFVAGHDWEIDNQLIDEMGVDHLKADSWENLLIMLKAGRADVVMQPFQATENLGFYDSDTKLSFLPIPNVKLPFHVGRKYFVSQNHPDGEMFLAALNRGIEMLNAKDDLIYHAHEWAGVINPRTENFKILNFQKGHSL